MRIITNFDTYNYIRHEILFGKVKYKNHTYDLDKFLEAFRLSIELYLDGHITFTKSKEIYNKPLSCYDVEYYIINNNLRRYHHQAMQLHTMLLNLKHAKIIR